MAITSVIVEFTLVGFFSFAFGVVSLALFGIDTANGNTTCVLPVGGYLLINGCLLLVCFVSFLLTLPEAKASSNYRWITRWSQSYDTPLAHISSGIFFLAFVLFVIWHSLGTTFAFADSPCDPVVRVHGQSVAIAQWIVLSAALIAVCIGNRISIHAFKKDRLRKEVERYEEKEKKREEHRAATKKLALSAVPEQSEPESSVMDKSKKEDSTTSINTERVVPKNGRISPLVEVKVEGKNAESENSAPSSSESTGVGSTSDSW